jgi:hypothetical protein
MGISVEVMPDAGAPQVGVTVDGLPSGSASTVSVEWSVDGRTWSQVRGAVREDVTEAGFFRDFVPPLNLETTYRVTTDAAITGASTAVLTVESGTAWLQDPLAPRSAVPVTWHHGDDGSVLLLSTSAASIARTQVADLVQVQGARLPVASLGVRRAPASVLMHLRALAAEQGALVTAVRALFEEAGTVVVRGLPAELGLDPVAHMIAPDLTDSPVVGGVLGMSEWQFEVTQVRAPSLRIAVPWWTYDQVAALWAGLTYDEVSAARPGATYLDWLRDPAPSASAAAARVEVS